MLSRLELPNGTRVDHGYDALQRLTSVQNVTNAGVNRASYSYAYDNRDVRTSAQSRFAGESLRQVSYGYDAVDQLTGESATGGAANWNYSNTFGYDAMGNRTRGENTRGGVTTTSRGSSNALNQLTALSRSASGATQTSGLSYDASGNLTQTANSDGSKTLYTYDDADRLTRLETRDAAGASVRKSEWSYDYTGRKVVTREFAWTNGAWVQASETRRVYDGMDVMQERNAANEVTAQYTRDGNIGGILARTTASGSVFYGYDGGGNVTLLTNEAGAEVGRYSYDVFGQTLEMSGAKAAENPFRFSTKELHAASGLYDYGFRFYSASTGRWLNRDPIQESGGVNLYAFVLNDPINKWDEYGEEAEHTKRKGSKKKTNDKHTKPRPGRLSEKKKLKPGWKPANPKKNSFQPPSGEDMAKGAVLVGGGYIAYRCIRMIPSLFPPLWPTAPANLVVP